MPRGAPLHRRELHAPAGRGLGADLVGGGTHPGGACDAGSDVRHSRPGASRGRGRGGALDARSRGGTAAGRGAPATDGLTGLTPTPVMPRSTPSPEGLGVQGSPVI